MESKKIDLSIVILSYNTRELLKSCLDSLSKLKDEISFEVIVSDNGSEDGSPDMVEREYSWARLIKGDENLGFAKGNNRARKFAKGEYVLFLNSDTTLPKNALKETVSYLDSNSPIGALTGKIVLPSGRLDKDARRSFPDPWVALTHFSGLDRIFPRSKIFSRYWYGHTSPEETQEVDVLQGAFFLVRRKILDEVGWFDEDYFLDGEDIDLCWKIKQKGWKIVYYPKVLINHVKGASKGKNKNLERFPSIHDRLRYVMSGVDSMEIFYKKRLWKRYPILLNILVLFGIKILKVLRYTKLLFS